MVPLKASFILPNKWDCSVAGLNCLHFANVNDSSCKEISYDHENQHLTSFL